MAVTAGEGAEEVDVHNALVAWSELKNPGNPFLVPFEYPGPWNLRGEKSPGLKVIHEVAAEVNRLGWENLSA